MVNASFTFSIASGGVTTYQPVPRRIAHSLYSFGIFSFSPARMAARSRGLELGSPPPLHAAIVISRMTRVKTRPRLASVAAFLCLIVAHFECPDMRLPRFDLRARRREF